MRAIIWNTPTLPLPGTMYFHVKKFMSGFENHGFDVIEVNNPDAMHQLTKDDIVYISHHGIDYFNSDISIAEFIKLAKLDCIFVMWHFHEHLQDEVAHNLPHRFVYTGEYYSPNSSYSNEKYDRYRRHDNYIPTKFLSALKPEQIGKFERHPTYDAQFVGSPYQPDIMRQLMTKFSIVGSYTPPFISEEARISTFLNAKCTLGFHDPANVRNGLITERVVEGMAFGCAVVSDNPMVEEFTDGCATYAASYDDFVLFLDRAKHDNAWLAERQLTGYEFAKSKGTYTHLAGDFIKKFADCGLN